MLQNASGCKCEVQSINNSNIIVAIRGGGGIGWLEAGDIPKPSLASVLHRLACVRVLCYHTIAVNPFYFVCFLCVRVWVFIRIRRSRLPNPAHTRGLAAGPGKDQRNIYKSSNQNMKTKTNDQKRRKEEKKNNNNNNARKDWSCRMQETHRDRGSCSKKNQVISHIRRIGCQPEKNILHSGQSCSWSAEQGEKKKKTT